MVSFLGTATLTIADSRFPGPFTSPLTLSPSFAGGGVELGALTPIVVPPFATPIGRDTLTVTKNSGGTGTFDRPTGTLRMPLGLHFAHSIALIGDSDASFTLTTGSSSSPSGAFAPTGTPLNRSTGMIVLVSGSRFRGGFLGGTDCSLTISGTFTPVP